MSSASMWEDCAKIVLKGGVHVSRAFPIVEKTPQTQPKYQTNFSETHIEVTTSSATIVQLNVSE